VSRRAEDKQQPTQGFEVLRSSLAFDMPATDEGARQAPGEFRVFPAGTFSTVKGEFTFSPRSAQSVIEHHQRRGLPLMGDYEHMTDSPSMGLGITMAPASITEMTPVVRLDANGAPELWVASVKWTKRAREFLEAGEYRLFSPTFLHDKETREILALLRIALTNDPAIDELQPLVAASSAHDCGHPNTVEAEENTMGTETSCAKCAATEAHLATLKAAHETLAAEHESLKARMKSFEQWADEEKKEHESLKALTGKDSKAEILGVLTAWKGQSEECVSLKASVEKAKQETLTAEYKSIADKAVADGKLPPAVRATYDKHVADRGVAFGLECLKAHVGATAAPVVNTTETTPPANADALVVQATLTAGEISEANKMGLDLKLVAESKQRFGKSLETRAVRA
jgi:phage I-like protein